MKKNVKVISGIIIVTIISLIIFLNKPTYSTDNSTFVGTREDLQKMVVAAAQSYYFNRNYSDYDQLAINPIYIEETGRFGTKYNALMNWRDFNNSPEMVSRTNMYNIDCSSFAWIVYLYSLGYDFSDYRAAKLNGEYVITSTYGTYDYDTGTWTNNNHVYTSLENYQEAYLSQGIGQSTTLSSMIKSQVANYDGFNSNVKTTNDKNSEFIYYYETELTDGTNNNLDDSGGDLEVTEDDLEGGDGCNTTNYNESCSLQSQIKDDFINALEPGDIVFYRTKNINTGNKYGHVIVYVGDLFNPNERGFIHSVGYDYNLKKDGTGSNGEDTYSVRYDTWDDLFELQIFKNSDKEETLLFSIIRPINNYCEKDGTGNEVCKIDNSTIKSQKYKDNIDLYLGNAIARKDLFNLATEQYQYKKNDNTDLITKYNSVNVGDIISYRLSITNESTFAYCNFGNYSSSKDYCENKGGIWKIADRSIIDYSNMQVKAKVPNGTTYSSCKMVLYITGTTTTITSTNCTYDKNSGVVTWSNINIPASNLPEECTLSSQCQYTFTLKVEANRTGKIVNEGMHIINGNDDMKFGELTTLVNYTINNDRASVFQNVIDEKIDDNYTGSILDFIKDVYGDVSGVNLNNLNYENIKNALFLDITTDDDHNESIYNVFVRKKSVSASLVNIKNMLVPGLYGGRRLKGNDLGDRARIVSKINKKMTLEVGDILVAYDFYSNKNYAYLFYGYDSMSRPIFALYDEEAGKIQKTPLATSANISTVTAKIGYRTFKSMYAFDLFAVLRPTMTYEGQILDVEATDSIAFNTNNMTVKNVPTGITLSNLLTKMETTNTMRITDKNGNAITNRDYVVTGDLLVINGGIDQNKYELLVVGDVNSDGNANTVDAKILSKYIIDKASTIDNKYLFAGDMNADDSIKMNDVVTILVTEP